MNGLLLLPRACVSEKLRPRWSWNWNPGILPWYVVSVNTGPNSCPLPGTLDLLSREGAEVPKGSDPLKKVLYGRSWQEKQQIMVVLGVHDVCHFIILTLAMQGVYEISNTHSVNHSCNKSVEFLPGLMNLL